MTKNLRSKRAKRTCAAKQKHATVAEAIAHAESLRRQGKPARVYGCAGVRGQQRHWHVTSGTKGRL